MTKIKICGIRDSRSARAAVSAGADFLGFNFVGESRRYIDPEDAARIMSLLGREVQTVGVFRNAPMHVVNDIIRRLGLDLAQLHGYEDAAYGENVNAPIIKMIRSNDGPLEQLLDEMRSYKADYYLLDRSKQGTGAMIDFDRAKVLAEHFPVFIAGGLNASNVVEAVQAAEPFAVDVAGGIEVDGRPDAEQIALFAANVRLA